jgi:3-hydroxy-9,10-secoandrosta-1,3,5(10)-triene-9,17-dione monooxygenase reductase component
MTFTSRDLRNALGEFTTGVTIITCQDEHKKPIGITANSFSALSLEPPLVLWSLAKKSGSLNAFIQHGYFAVNVLNQPQQELALKFSKPSEDRFAGVDYSHGSHGLPLLGGSLAQFVCKTTQTIMQGDHMLFIGEVEAVSKAEVSSEGHSSSLEPLVFSRGKFKELGSDSTPSSASETIEKTHDLSFYKDYLPYLLARAAHDSAGHFHVRLKDFGLNMLSWRVMACLADGQAWTVNDLCKVSVAKQPTVSKLLDRLETQRWITRTRASGEEDARKVMVTLTRSGLAKIAPVIKEAKGYGETLSGRLSASELLRLKSTLLKLMDER